MPVTNEQYDLYRPTRLKVISLGIGISDETNDQLNLTNTQHLIVGETLLNPGSGVVEKAYGLIVDKQGIAVNATLPDRAAQSNVYAAYIEGNVFITGNLVACNVISEGGSGGSGGGGASNFWIQSTGDRDSIYFPGRITFGNRGNNIVARNNTHACAIVESADRTINHAQVSVQNTQLSEFRVGILGTSNISPAVVNTVPGTPLEFHVARDQDYFSNVYTRSYWEYGSNVTTTAEVPRYSSPTNAPHMVIDTDGTVGMRIAALPRIPAITAEQATPVPTGTGVVFPVVTEKMALHVNGPAFASNLLIWDHQSNVPVNIDRLFVRRYGATFDANQVIPGPFVAEPYVFPDKLGVGGDPDPGDFQLTVNGAERVTEYLQVDGLTQVNRFEARNAVLLDIASFCNDVYILRDIIVGESIRLRGGMYAEYPADGGSNGTVWCNVQFQLADTTLSNVNYFGIGLSTPGRFGVGINPNTDEVNHQFVVRKRSADIYEQEIMDKTSPTLYKAAYIGHPNTAAEREDDASLVFATPGAFNTNYNFRSGVRAPQNVYFYPGDYDPINAAPIVTNSNPPTLNVDTRRRVGIRTFDPLGELDVRGNIILSGNIYKINPALVNEINDLTPQVGLWTEATFSSPLPSAGSNVTFRGVQYLQSNVIAAAIHTQPDARYGLTLTGGLRADQQYGADDVLVSHWASGPTATGDTPAFAGAGSRAAAGASFDPTVPAQSGSMFTYKTVGVGVTNPGGAELTLRNVRGASGTPGAPGTDDDTILRLYRGTPTASRTRIELGGVNTPWIIAGDDAARRLEIGYGSNSITGTDATAKRALWMRYNTDTARQQVVVGGDLGVFDVGRSNPDPNAALTVDGNVSVIGDMRVSGHYYMGGSLFVNCNLVPEFRLPANTDDVLVAGNIISFNPVNITSAGVTTYGFMGVGFTTTALQVERTTTDQTPFRVYQPNQEIATVGRFQATGNTALIDLVNRAGDKLRFGVQAGGRFAFLDKNNAAYMEFASDPATGQRFFGLNTDVAQPINATLHIQNTGQASNMLRLSRYGVGDTAGAAPEVELEKTIVNGAITTTTRWLMHGPDQYNQKLSFVYGTGALTDPAAQTREELMTLTNTGCLGIGNTAPEYALDIIGGNKLGSIRMLNTSPDPTPQLIFQSDSNVYGSDASTDYRFYSSNDSFILDSEDTLRGYRKLLHFNANGRAAMRTNPDDRYALNVGGPLNLLQTLYIDGNPLFSTVGEEGTIFDISATNIYLRPFVPAQGGVVINGNQPTSNLFHVFSGSNGTMQVLDSLYDSALIHLRTQPGGPGNPGGVFNRYTVGVSNVDFGFWYGSNTGRPSMIGDATGTGSGLARLATIGPNRRAAAAAAGKAEASVYGDLRLGDVQLMTTSTATPTGGALIVAHQSNVTAAQDNELSLVTSAILQTIGGNQQVAFSATQFGSKDIAQFRNVTIVGEEPLRVVVDNAGYIGIGTTAPTAPFHVGPIYANAGSPGQELAVRVDVGAAQVPSLRFTPADAGGVGGAASGVRLTTPAAAAADVGSLIVLTGATAPGTERLRVSAAGHVGIGAGTQAPRARLDVTPIASSPATPIFAAFGSNAVAAPGTTPPALFVSADAWVGIGTDLPALPPAPASPSPSDPAAAYARSALTVSGGNATFGGALLPATTLAHDLGSSNARWRDLYLSGTTMNLGGTKVTRDAATGNVTLADDANAGLRGVTTSAVTIGDSAPQDSASPIRITLSSNPLYNPATPGLAPPLLYLAYDAASDTTTSLEPLMKGSDSDSAIQFSSLYLSEESLSSSNAALLVDRVSGASNLAIAQFRADQTPVFTIFQTGAVGIGAAAIPDPGAFGYPPTEAVYPPRDPALQTCLSVAFSNVGPDAAIASFTQLATSENGPGDLLRLCSPASNVASDVRFRVTYDGRVGIGLTSGAPAAGDRLSISGNLNVADGTATFGSNVYVTNGGTLDVAGSIYSGGNLVTASDIRLKSDLQRITGALTRLDKIAGYTFTRPAAADPRNRETGVVAQEVASVLPEAVSENSEGYLAVAYGNLAGLMIEAIKELRSEVQAIRGFIGMPTAPE